MMRKMPKAIVSFGFQLRDEMGQPTGEWTVPGQPVELSEAELKTRIADGHVVAPAVEPETGEPLKAPAKSASRETWAAYAGHLGASGELLESATRDELAAAFGDDPEPTS
jgi:hypothetical protein